MANAVDVDVVVVGAGLAGLRALHTFRGLGLSVAVLDASDIATRAFDHPRAGEHPLAEAIDRFILGDVLIHTWDLSRATGLDEHLDDTMVNEMLIGLEPMADVLVQSGHYGPRVPIAVEADPQSKLLALTGRRV